jgi:hypothetical protein
MGLPIAGVAVEVRIALLLGLARGCEAILVALVVLVRRVPLRVVLRYLHCLVSVSHLQYVQRYTYHKSEGSDEQAVLSPGSDCCT